MIEENDETKQVRMTLEDTLRYQSELSDLMKQLIKENRPMSDKERKRIPELLAKALLTQGAVKCVTMVIEGGWFTFASLQNMILRTSEITKPYVRLTTHRPEHNTQVGSIAEMWKFIYGQLLYYYPLASAEAFRVSKESMYRVEQGSFEFDSRSVI